MSVVQTLNGAIDSSDMGYTLSHEHIFVHDEGLVSNFPSVWNEAFVIQKAREKILQAYETGTYDFGCVCSWKRKKCCVFEKGNAGTADEYHCMYRHFL